jgi:sialidase-1
MPAIGYSHVIECNFLTLWRAPETPAAAMTALAVALQLSLLLGAATAAAGSAPAWQPSPKCQAQADKSCAKCYSALKNAPRNCDGPMVARRSGAIRKGDEWRCYSPSTLTPDHRNYSKGSCYCTEDPEIRQLLKTCGDPDPSPAPPTPPPPLKPGEAPCEGCVAVFYAGLNSSKCFRIPTIINTLAGTLLAFAENRITDCGDNGPHHDLVVRRSTNDGATWGPMSIAVKGTVPCPGCPAAISNPNPVEVKLQNGSLAVLLAYDTMNNPRGAKHGMDRQIWSFDDGITWTDDSIVSYPPNPNIGGLIGPSVGIQNAKGVIFFSDSSGQFIYYSQDYGTSWRSTAPHSPPPSSECSAAFLVSATDGRIIQNCRTGVHKRLQIIWSADIPPVPLNATYPPGLIDPGCQGSIINQRGVLLTSNSNTTSGRTHATVKRSTDLGTTWSSGVLVWPGPSAYSQLVSLGDPKTVGLLWEAGKSNAYETISFKKVALPTA